MLHRRTPRPPRATRRSPRAPCASPLLRIPIVTRALLLLLAKQCAPGRSEAPRARCFDTRRGSGERAVGTVIFTLSRGVWVFSVGASVRHTGVLMLGRGGD